jgi:hypothetical protein
MGSLNFGTPDYSTHLEFLLVILGLYLYPFHGKRYKEVKRARDKESRYYTIIAHDTQSIGNMSR